MIHELFNILERHRAERVRAWAEMDVLLTVVDATTAAEILHFLKKSSDFAKKFVSECLPRERRECSVNYGALFRLLNLQESGTEESVRKAIEKGKQLVAETMKTVEIAKLQS